MLGCSDFSVLDDGNRDNTSSPNCPAGLLLTPKALYNKAQGLRGRGAPWVRNERNASNPNGQRCEAFFSGKKQALP